MRKRSDTSVPHISINVSASRPNAELEQDKSVGQQSAPPAILFKVLNNQHPSQYDCLAVVAKLRVQASITQEQVSTVQAGTGFQGRQLNVKTTACDGLHLVAFFGEENMSTSRAGPYNTAPSNTRSVASVSPAVNSRT